MRGRVGKPEEERLRFRRPASDEADRLSGKDVLLEVGGVGAVLDQGAVLVERVAVDLLVRARAPLRPALRHQRAEHVAVQVPADHCGVVTRVAQPDGEVVRSVPVHGLEAAEAAVWRLVIEHTVVVHVLPGQEGGARGAAERVVDEALPKRHPPAPDQRLDVAHDPHRLERLVVGLDHHNVRPRLRGLAEGRRRCPRSGDRQCAGHGERDEDRYEQAPGNDGAPRSAAAVPPHPPRP